MSCDVLRRVRRHDRRAGVWEAADLQWWWRVPRASDTKSQLIHLDEDGPLATARVTEWRHGWQLDVLRAPGSGFRFSHLADPVWNDLLSWEVDAVECLIQDDDEEAVDWLETHGFTATGGDYQGWLSAAGRRPVPAIPHGYRIVDRSTHAEGDHPFVARNGPDVEERLRACPLYDPRLDLAVVTDDDELAGSSLYWADAATGIGLVEPVRIEEAHEGRGLGTAMVAAGVERLAARGADLLKVAWETERAGRLYRRLGFSDAVACAAYRWERDAPGADMDR